MPYCVNRLASHPDELGKHMPGDPLVNTVAGVRGGAGCAEIIG